MNIEIAPRRATPVTVHRTDSSTQTASTPPAHKFDTKPNANGVLDYFKLLPSGHEKELLWRWKLATMVIETLEPQRLKGREAKSYMLTSLPEHYQLYEYIHKEKPERKNAVAKQSVELYLFGYPSPGKCYRSPSEFAPHMLWLGMTGGEDRSKCECVICKGKSGPLPWDELPVIDPEVPKTKIQDKVQQAPTSLIKSLHDLHLEKWMQLDGHQSIPLFRPLEVVWALPDGPFPRISVVLSRDTTQKPGSRSEYITCPLNSPRIPSKGFARVTEDKIRPWLSWTAPTPECKSLLGDKGEKPWKAVDWSRYPGSGTEVSDASVLGGREIARSLSPILKDDGMVVGIWLGAEKVWVGGEIRVATGVMVISKINVNVQRIEQITFVGNIYARGKEPYHHQFPRPPPTDRMMGDAYALQSYWALRGEGTTITLLDVKGRWYPTSVMRPILDPDPSRPREDIGQLLNQMTDGPRSLGGWKYILKRLDAVTGTGERYGGGPTDPAGWLPFDWQVYLNEQTPVHTPQATVPQAAHEQALVPQSNAVVQPATKTKSVSKPQTASSTTKPKRTKKAQAQPQVVQLQTEQVPQSQQTQISSYMMPQQQQQPSLQQNIQSQIPTSTTQSKLQSQIGIPLPNQTVSNLQNVHQAVPGEQEVIVLDEEEEPNDDAVFNRMTSSLGNLIPEGQWWDSLDGI